MYLDIFASRDIAEARAWVSEVNGQWAVQENSLKRHIRAQGDHS